jgi:hypothetical protein
MNLSVNKNIFVFYFIYFKKIFYLLFYVFNCFNMLILKIIFYKNILIHY